MAERISGKDRSLAFCGSTPLGEVSLVSLLSNQFIDMGITEIQIAFGASIPKDLPALAKACFGINIFEGQICYMKRDFGAPDLSFAEEFGYKVVPNFAFLKLTRNYPSGGKRGQRIEAWVSPVLIAKRHALFEFGNQNAIAIFKQQQVSTQPTGSETMVMLGFGEETPKHYIRVRVLDEPLALAQVCKVIGDSNINISGLRQPESIDKISTDVAIVVNRCPTVRFQEMKNILQPLTTLPIID